MNQINLDDFIIKLVNASEAKDISVELAAINFIEYLKQNDKSVDTIKFYQEKMNTMLKYMDTLSVRKTSQITNDFFYNYMNYVKKVKNYKNTTINKYLTALKYMLRINMKYGYIQEIKLDIQKLTDDDTSMDIVPDEVMQELVRIKGKYSLRDNIMISILIDTGIRRTELVKIKIKNIDFKINCILLEHTKNKKKRFCFFTEQTAELLQEYLVNNEKLYLFSGKTEHEHLEANAVSQMFKKIKKDLNVDCLSPHMLRHTYATNLDKQNVDIESMRLLLGHSDYSQLKRYLHKEQEKLRFASLTSNIYK